MLLKTRRKGFTLVEILIVVSIIAILMSLVIASVQNAKASVMRTLASNTVAEPARDGA